MDKNSDRSAWWQGWLEAEDKYLNRSIFINDTDAIISYANQGIFLGIGVEWCKGVLEYFDYIGYKQESKDE